MKVKRFLDSPVFVEHPLVFMVAKKIGLGLLQSGTTEKDVDCVFYTVNLLSLALQEGSSFVDLKHFADKSYPSKWQVIGRFPPLAPWLRLLKQSLGAFQSHVQLEETRLFFPRMFQVETFIANNLVLRSKQVRPLNENLWQACGEDFQKIAVANSLGETLSFIVGGPGTGKTTTVSQLLIEVLKAEGHNNYHIQLAAPTGKAATRLSQSIYHNVRHSDLPDDLKARVPKQALTIHRLLGWSNRKQGFKFNQENPLLLDCLIIDETSMIDIQLFASLLKALPLGCRLIFLGDPHQLPSVDAGAILSDICTQKAIDGFSKTKCALNTRLVEGHFPLADQVVALKKSYRFSDDKGIGAFASAYLHKDLEKLTKALASDEVIWVDKVSNESSEEVTLIENRLKQHFYALTRAQGIDAAFLLLEQFQCLCANKTGAFSTEYFNNQMLSEAKRQGLSIYRLHGLSLFHGQPVIIESNRYDLG
ncbi:MAG: AAA family ATPase, partial [Cellvibrionales bacterium]|nr:AAA family ATPase [Cellvibrionales bacterium]